MKKKFGWALSLLAFAALGLAGCGGGDEDESASSTVATTESSTSTGGGTGGGTDGTGGAGGEGGTVSLTADPDGALAYEQTSASVPAGSVTIKFDNPASLGHDVIVEDAEGAEVAKTDVISGESTTASADLAAGEYTFYCSVDSHREAGMEGTLTVE